MSLGAFGCVVLESIKGTFMLGVNTLVSVLLTTWSAWRQA